ncbi:MAG: histidine phosphatase family protein [Clostridia bacterium]|nr:histidine phosphatase family protein [Clostridia bacterium]
MRLYYVRHGAPIYDPDGLTEYGKQQAEHIRDVFRRYRPDRIFTSASRRAQMTAQPTCEMLGIEPQSFDWAHESVIGQSFGTFDDDIQGWTWVWNSRKYKEMFADPEVVALWDKWYTHPYFENTPLPSGFLAFKKEQDAWLETLGYRRRETFGFEETGPHPGRIAFFAHGGCGMVFLSTLLGIPFPVYVLRVIEHVTTGISVIDLSAENGIVYPRLVAFNMTPHLFSHNLDNDYKF